MKATEFCYWLQGYFEIAGQAPGLRVDAMRPDAVALTRAQVDMIKRHLALVFVHDIDPQAGDPEHQSTLQSIHDGGPARPGGTGPNGEIVRC